MKKIGSLMPCPFTGPKMFCAGPIFLCQTKIFFTYCGSHKNFVPDKKMICIQKNCFLCRHKSFWRGTKCSQIFGLAQKIWTGTKHFGTCKRTRHQWVAQTKTDLSLSGLVGITSYSRFPTVKCKFLNFLILQMV